VRDGLARGLLETILTLTGTVLVVGDTLVPAVENGFAAGMALIGAGAASYGARFTTPGGKDDS
jgi:hypothetical protein